MKRPRILAVDDEVSLTSLVRLVLERAGFAVRTENDATKAVQAARDFKPGLVLLDCRMPQISGFEIASQIASDVEMKRFRIAFFTGTPRDEIATHFGSDDFLLISKPISYEELLGFVLEHTPPVS